MKYETCTPPPVPVITGTAEPCVNSGDYFYSTESGMTAYQWNISTGGTISSGQGTNTIQVIWNQPGSQWVSVTYTNANGCVPVNPTQFAVLVAPPPNPAGPISGPEVVCAGSEDILYSIEPVSNALTYIWSLPLQAKITSGEGTNAIVVKFDDNSISGNFKVDANNLCGNGNSSPLLFVTINPIPPAPTIAANDDTLISSAPFGNQWFYNGFLLVNDTSQTHVVNPRSQGYYWTQVTLHDCVSDTSSHFYYTTSGLMNSKISGLTIYPDPASTSLLIEIDGYFGPVRSIEIYDMNGTRIFETESDKHRIVLNVETYHEGVYIIKVKTETSLLTGRFCKI
jgi:hypothetical protein